MTIERGQYELDSDDVIELTEKIIAIKRGKDMHQAQQNESLVIPQTTLPTAHDLSIVIPTRNERDNIEPLLEALQNALYDMSVEIIFVDDSDDDTAEIIADRAKFMGSSQFHIQVEHRLAGEARVGGLATAVSHGMSKAQAEYIAILDADLQHPPELLHVFYNKAVAQDVDLVVASRYIKGGGYQGLDGVGRLCISVGMKCLAKLLFPGQLLRISDPLGGFFLVRRSLLTGISLRPIGYKILLEVLIRCPWQRALEVPYHFQLRAHGQSKSNTKQGLLALQHMQRLWTEVPAAGRPWKIGFLLFTNVLFALILFLINKQEPWVLTTLSTIIFGLVAFLDFMLLNRFIFPSALTANAFARPLYSVISLEEIEAVVSPAITAVEELKMDALLLPAPLSSEHAEGAKCSSSVANNMPGEEETMNLQRSVAPLNAAIGSSKTANPSSTTHARKSFVDLILKRYARLHFINLIQKRYEKLLFIVMVALVVLAIGWISYTLPGALLVIATLFIGMTIIFMRNAHQNQAITMLLSIAVGVATIDYISWRFVVTNWYGWWIAVPLLFAETLGALHTLGFQFTVWPWSPPKVERREDPTRHPIFIFIPTVNEGPAILRPTLQGIMAARDKYLASYPHGQVTIVICNDGRVAQTENWEEAEVLAKELGVCCVTRTKRGGAKAGNIENARQQLQATGDALIIIFDADQVAKPDFLLKTVPHFSDPKMGWVQTGQYYANLNNPVSRWADDQQSMFYNLLCPGKATLNATFICGTNVVIRAAALDAIGGLPQDSVTEDFAASINLHASWRSIYLTDILATGLGPLDVPSYLKQQSRWAMGTLGVFRTHWREILLPRRHGLRLGQRVQYFLACTHYLCGLRDLIYLLSPILFIFTGVPAVGGATLNEYLWHFLPYGLLSATAMWYSSRGITGLRGIVIGFGSFPVLITSLLSVILKRKVGFSVTSKQRDGKRSLNYLGVYLFSLLLCIVSLLWITQVKGQQQISLFISGMWVVYSIVMLGGFLWLNFKDIRFQTFMLQSGAVSETIADQPYPSKLAVRKSGLQPLWNVGLALLVAGPIFASSSFGSLAFSMIHSSSPSFVISQEKIAAPYVGLSLPVQLLTKQPPMLERALDTQFSIIGRTQDVHDYFDKPWADQLAARHARPWITLQFGVFDANHNPPLDANLPAIINGLHDQTLRRWAEDIRDYGKPVYLTILTHADRNWSLSSGVANGGIPQDVPKAWMHVQSVFRSVGASNVAWVWAPADPIHDQEYAPPASTIDAVLQSFINYPGAKWGNPETVLRDLTRHYPAKPIFVEASANGPATLKAAWITRLGQAVNDVPQVYALLYHEGGPELRLSSTQIQHWSLASDPESLAAMRLIVVSLRDKTTART